MGQHCKLSHSINEEIILQFKQEYFLLFKDFCVIEL